jgi:nucleoside-diphosphate-sugar epimerase
MTVLVTGGSGLVGSHVLAALRARGEPARALVRPDSRTTVERFGAEPVVGDVTDPGAWKRAGAGAGAIVHAAALVASRASFDEFMRVNVGGTRLAVETARRLGVRLVHVSTVAVYGRAVAPPAGRPGIGEDFPFQSLSEHDYYARSKRAAEEIVREEARRGGGGGGLSIIAIRPNVIYGERDKLFTARVIAAMRRRVLPQIGPGSNHLSCVYAGNVASAILAALDAPAVGKGFRAYNVTRDAPPPLTEREFFNEFARGLGRNVHFIPVPIAAARVGVAVWSAVMRLLSPGRYTGLAAAAVSFIAGENPYATERIRAELGWEPPFDARTAIARATQASEP